MLGERNEIERSKGESSMNLKICLYMLRIILMAVYPLYMHSIVHTLKINDDYHLYRGEGGELASKKDFINTARLIAKESDEVVKMAKKVAAACTDKRMKRVSSQ